MYILENKPSEPSFHSMKTYDVIPLLGKIGKARIHSTTRILRLCFVEYLLGKLVYGWEIFQKKIFFFGLLNRRKKSFLCPSGTQVFLIVLISRFLRSIYNKSHFLIIITKKPIQIFTYFIFTDRFQIYFKLEYSITPQFVTLPGVTTQFTDTELKKIKA